jgi:SSS family solute:Na+ symporter
MPADATAAAPAAALLSLSTIDYLVIGVYFLFVIGIGVLIRRRVHGASDFFESGRSLPSWICALGFIGANLGAQEVMGMAASGAKYGFATAHFYWLGAIPAMVFVGVFMMPFYYGSKARSVPDYLKLRFDEKTRTFNALSFAVMTVMSSGISLFALATLFETLVGWPFHLCVVASGLIVLVYITMGGLTSAIYNEVVQFFLIVFGFLPLVLLGLHQVGGWDGLTARLSEVARAHGYAAGSWIEIGKHMGSAKENPMGVEWIGLAMGLGFVLSFGYWCTDFLVVQRAMAARDLTAARRTPLIAAVPKMAFPFLVILPGMIAVALSVVPGSGMVFPIRNGEPDYNQVVPLMLDHFLPAGMLGLGLTALMASFMSGMAGNVTAFNTVWTYDLYQGLIKKDGSDAHYLLVGRWTTVVGILLSMAAAYLASAFNNIMDMLQLVFAFVNAPLFATFLLGMFWKRTTGHGAFAGLLGGTLGAAIHHGLTQPAGAVSAVKGGWLCVLHVYPSDMAQNFYAAIVAWSTCFVVTILVSLMTKPKPENELAGLVYGAGPAAPASGPAWLAPGLLGSLILLAVLVLNILFW